MYPDLHLGSLVIPSYFLIISLDFIFLIYLLRWRCKLYRVSLTTALDASLVGIFVGTFFARMFHVFYEGWDYYQFYPWDILKIWKGGFTVLPGIAAGILSGLLWLKRSNKNILIWLDVFTPLFPLGYAIGRWGCFLQGCCYGGHTESKWGFVFALPLSLGDAEPRWPTQLWTSMAEFLLFGLILIVEKTKTLKSETSKVWSHGLTFEMWLVGHGFNRLMMEVWREDDRGALLVGQGISFWMAGGIIILGFYFLIRRLIVSQYVVPNLK